MGACDHAGCGCTGFYSSFSCACGMPWAEHICTDQWMVITVAFLLPLMQVPAFTQFGHIAAIASVITLYGTAVYLGQILANGQYVTPPAALAFV